MPPSVAKQVSICLPERTWREAFLFPKAVLADQELLSTLPAKQIVSGLGEIIKYALIEDTIVKNTDYERGQKSLLDVLESSISDTFAWDECGNVRNHNQMHQKYETICCRQRSSKKPPVCVAA